MSRRGTMRCAMPLADSTKSQAETTSIPARDAIFDESSAAFRDLLLLLFCLYKLARVADRHGPGEAIRMLDLVELTLDCLAQFNLIGDTDVTGDSRNTRSKSSGDATHPTTWRKHENTNTISPRRACCRVDYIGFQSG